MMSFRREFSASHTHGEKACLPNGASSTMRRASPFQSQAFEQHQPHYDYPRHEYQPAGQKKSVQSSMKSVKQVAFDPSPPGMYPNDMYPNDMTVPCRPPMIMEATIRDYKDRNQSGGHGKDIHRHLRVVHVIGEFIREHNERHREDPYMQYRWYGSGMPNSMITGTLFAIIEDTAHALIHHLYSRFTYSDAQRTACSRMESMVAAVASHKMFDPLTQTLRVFGIRRLIQDKMATKKKTTDRRKKVIGQNEQLKQNVQISTLPQNDEATLTVPGLPSNAHAISNSSDLAVLAEEIRCEPLDTPGQQEGVQQECTENLAMEPQFRAEHAVIQQHLLQSSGQATELNNPETSRKLSPADYEKSLRKAGAKAKKIKGEKYASRPTKSKPNKTVRQSAVTSA